MKTLFILLICMLPLIALSQGQLRTQNPGKLSPSLSQAIKTNPGVLRLIVGVTNAAEFKQKFSSLLIGMREVNPRVMVITVKSLSLLMLQASPLLEFADLADRSPKEELILDGLDLTANTVNLAHDIFPDITGENLIVSIKENMFDSTDIDLKGRVINSGISSATISGHANIMATMIAGAGNTHHQGKGVALKAGLQSANFSSLVPESDAFYQAQKISVQNHSYGTAIENYYGADAAAYDASAMNNASLLHVFSSGNSGLLPGGGAYNGIPGFANLTGSFKMAKNNLVVGGTDSLLNVEAPSSKGPAYDGRIKPELVAFGQDGSSGAAAIVSGAALLLQQAYANTHQNALPPSALVKATLINTAINVGPPGPDYASGYGSVNVSRALRNMQNSYFFTGNISQGNTDTYTLSYPASVYGLRFTLVWTDPPAAANASRALVNDLDLEITRNTEIFLPWVLSTAANQDSLSRPATRGRDTVNNVENISIEGLASGLYQIKVKGSRVTGAQRYYLAYSFESREALEWRYPRKNDPVQGGSTATLRFHSTFTFSSVGDLQYSLGDGNWTTIATNVDLTKEYYRWNVPDTFSKAIVRLVIRDVQLPSDTFTISKRIEATVGLSCPDSFLVYWSRPKNVNSFRIYRLGAKFLEPVTVTNDTFYVNSTAAFNSKHIAIAPLIANREAGIRSYTFNYTTQGTGCYFRSFLTQLGAGNAQLAFELGSLYNVGSIVVQKISGNNVQVIQTISNPAALQYSINDASLMQGANIYRIGLQLKNGRVVYSNPEVVYFTGNTDYLVYPNPAKASAGFKILQKDAESFQISLHDAAGRMLRREDHSDLINNVSTIDLQKGLYIITIMKEGKKVFTGKIVLQ